MNEEIIKAKQEEYDKLDAEIDTLMTRQDEILKEISDLRVPDNVNEYLGKYFKYEKEDKYICPSKITTHPNSSYIHIEGAGGVIRKNVFTYSYSYDFSIKDLSDLTEIGKEEFNKAYKESYDRFFGK